MPMIVYKEKLKFNDVEENISIAFDCEYGEEGNFLKLKNYKPDYFDSGDFRIKVQEAVSNFDVNTLEKYREKTGVHNLAILNYFVDQIPSLYSIKFTSETSESIYYVDDLK